MTDLSKVAFKSFMTVEELSKKLADMPKEAYVVFEFDSGNWGAINKEVIYKPLVNSETLKQQEFVILREVD